MNVIIEKEGSSEPCDSDSEEATKLKVCAAKHAIASSQFILISVVDNQTYVETLWPLEETRQLVRVMLETLRNVMDKEEHAIHKETDEVRKEEIVEAEKEIAPIFIRGGNKTIN